MGLTTGIFLYPPDNHHFEYNYRDLIIVSWETYQPNFSACQLELYYKNESQSWKLNYNETVPANGSAMVPLDITGSAYSAQLSLNYTLANGGSGLYLSEIFIVDINAMQSPVTWSEPSAASSLRTSTSIALSTADPQSVVAGQTLTSASLQSAPYTSTVTIQILASGAPPPASSFNSADVAALSIGSTLIFGVACAVMLLGLVRFRKKRRVKIQPKKVAKSSEETTGPLNQGHTLNGASAYYPSELYAGVVAWELDSGGTNLGRF
ncbi:MAG: hypothetical protein MMC33_010112 [Icmadophila ericetorum]|nr:hypothetical protein [Icmadophila ericetorum]